MKLRNSLMFFLLAASAAWSQEISGPVPAVAGSAAGGDRMVTPTPVSNQGYSSSFAVEEPRSNYLSAGISLGGSYDDNIFMSTPQVHDAEYTVSPSIALEQSRSLLRWDLSYHPDFTFYQNHSSYDQVGQNLYASADYHLSPYVTLSVNDSFIRTSNMLGQLYQNLSSGTVNGAQPPSPDTIIAPLADRVSNVASAELTYQFARNGMVGASGTFTDLQYLDQPQGVGLFDSRARAANAFYTHRLSVKHYIGASYGFQDLLTSPGNGVTQTNNVLLFYTLYLNSASSVAVFAGPEHSATRGPGSPSFDKWSPAVGGTFVWKGARTSVMVSVSQTISQGGGLPQAVQSESVGASLCRQLTKTFTVGFGSTYSNSTYLQSLASGTGGHTFSTNVSVSRSLGQHFALDLSYTRLQQSYSNLLTAAASADRNRVWASLSYKFDRPLGR